MNKNGQVASFAVQNESINEYVKTLETRAKVETSENIYLYQTESKRRSEEGAPCFSYNWFAFRNGPDFATSHSFTLAAPPSFHFSLNTFLAGLHFLE